MNCKAKGNRQEHRTIARLEGEGYQCTRAAGSLGLFDVVAIGPDDVLLVQVKSNRRPGAAEMNAIAGFKAAPICKKLVYIWKDRQSVPVIIEL